MLRNINEVAAKISAYIRSGVQCVQLVVGGQANAAETMLRAIANEREMDYVSWNPATGFGKNVCINPVQAIEAITSDTGPISSKRALVAVHDMHYDLNAIPALVSSLKLAIASNQFSNPTRCRTVFLITTNQGLNQDLLPYVKVIEMVHPSREQLEVTFNKVQSAINDPNKRVISDELKHTIISALAGLTCPDAENVLAESLVKHGRWCEDIIETIEEEKGLLLKKSEVLTYSPKSEIMSGDELGGFTDLKSWLEERKVAYSSEAEDLQLDMPKGLVLIGVPGTGKSRAAQVIARVLGQPLIRFDIGAVFNSLVGESERRTRETIQTADAMGGCVLLIDEADKVLGGASESTGDSGVTRRIFGQLLTWLAEKKSKTFVVLTMNRINGMPPELLRRGRFDEIFFVDTPDEEERKTIFDIHMRKRNVNVEFNAKEWTKIINASEGFVGAEIEQAIIAARFNAYANNPESKATFSSKELLAALNDLVPVTKVDPENIEQIRVFGKDRARNVSGRKSLKTNVRAVDLSFKDPNIA